VRLESAAQGNNSKEVTHLKIQAPSLGARQRTLT
jgi:hypothetical protein